MLKYLVEILDLPEKKVTIEIDGYFSSVKIFIDGKYLIKNKNNYIFTEDNGDTITIKTKYNIFFKLAA